MSCIEYQLPTRDGKIHSRARVLPEKCARIDFSPENVDEKLTTLKHHYTTHSNRMSVCLTVYNEPQSQVQQSLEAIYRNAEFLSQKSHVRELVVAIIVDGVEQLAPCSRDFFEREGYLEGECTEVGPLSLHWTRQQWRDHSTGDQTFIVHRLLLIKQRNAGKLHSHWCYYHILQWLLPASICAQMDAGTAPAADAFGLMWGEFSEKSELAALAANSLLSQPPDRRNALDVFQYASFLDERYALWPREQLTGYLTVLPGQLHMVRWRALTGPARRHLDESSFTERLVQAEQCPVLAAYLGGLDANNAIDATAFLAEDRILGLALSRAEQGRWQLGYLPAAKAATDACQSWLELLRQRRRWLCGGTACLAKFLLAPGPAAARLHGLWMLMLLALSPSFGMITLFAMGAEVRAAGTADHWIVLSYCLSAVASIAGLCWALACWQRRWSINLELLAALGVAIGTGCWLLSGALYLAVAAPTSAKLITIIGAAIALCLSSATVLFYDRQDARGRLRVLPCYLATRHAIRLLLSLYALTNCHDLSWGTKGLATADKHARSGLELRWQVVSVVVGMNLTALLVLVALPATALSYWLPMVAMVLVGERAVALAAHFLLYRRSQPEQELTPDQTFSIESR